MRIHQELRESLALSSGAAMILGTAYVTLTDVLEPLVSLFEPAALLLGVPDHAPIRALLKGTVGYNAWWLICHVFQHRHVYTPARARGLLVTHIIEKPFFGFFFIATSRPQTTASLAASVGILSVISLGLVYLQARSIRRRVRVPLTGYLERPVDLPDGRVWEPAVFGEHPPRAASPAVRPARGEQALAGFSATVAVSSAVVVILSMAFLELSLSVRLWPIIHLVETIRRTPDWFLVLVLIGLLAGIAFDVLYRNSSQSAGQGLALLGGYLAGLIGGSVAALAIDIPRSAAGVLIMFLISLWEERNFPLFTAVEALLILGVAVGAGVVCYVLAKRA